MRKTDRRSRFAMVGLMVFSLHACNQAPVPSKGGSKTTAAPAKPATTQTTTQAGDSDAPLAQGRTDDTAAIPAPRPSQRASERPVAPPSPGIPTGANVPNTMQTRAGKAVSALSGPLTLLALGIALVLSLIALLRNMATILRWRRTVPSGMEAVIPVQLEENLTRAIRDGVGALAAQQVVAIQRMAQLITQLHDAQQQHDLVLTKLRTELDRKDADNKHLRNLVASSERDSHIRRVIKLANFVGNLRLRAAAGTTSASDALQFLSEEVMDTIAEQGVDVFTPQIGSFLGTLDSEHIDVVDDSTFQISGASHPNATIATVLAPAYLRTIPGGETHVLQRARVSITPGSIV